MIDFIALDRLAAADPGYAVWADIILPIISIIATLGLGVTAFVLGVKSYNTAKRATSASETANDLVIRIREEDKAEKALAWRREFGIELRDWNLTERISSFLTEVRDPDSDPKMRDLKRRAQLAGVDSAFALAEYHEKSAIELRTHLSALSDEERAEEQGSKNIVKYLGGHSTVIDEWIEDPETFERREAEAQAAKRAAIQRAALERALQALGSNEQKADEDRP